jgi:SAM-dependent methyltransferase
MAAESAVVTNSPKVVNDYDSFAEAYTSHSDADIVNAYYERPAILALAADVTGRRILDAGCGSGPIAAALRERGATVTGIDCSAKMLELARQRLGDSADRCRSPPALVVMRENLSFDLHARTLIRKPLCAHSDYPKAGAHSLPQPPRCLTGSTVTAA